MTSKRVFWLWATMPSGAQLLVEVCDSLAHAQAVRRAKRDKYQGAKWWYQPMEEY